MGPVPPQRLSYCPREWQERDVTPLGDCQAYRHSNFVVFDSDADEQDPGKRAKHEKDNKALLALLGKANENPLPTTSLWGPGFVMWRSNIGALIRAEIGAADWSAFQAKADKQYGHAGGLRKNTLHIGFCLAQAWESGKSSPSLERLCNEILNPAVTVQ